MRGKFITFEGGEGTGKSTQIKRIAKRLEQAGIQVMTTREPGGSPGAEAIRHVLLSGAAEPFGPDMEAILFAAARSDHVEQVIRPALDAGITVLCDRFYDSTRVYQGVTGNVDAAMLRRLEEVVCEDAHPDLTIILDLDPDIAVKRTAERRGEAAPDRFEKENIDMQRARREGFLDIAMKEPYRCVVIDASGNAADIEVAIWHAIIQRLEELELDGAIAREASRLIKQKTPPMFESDLDRAARNVDEIASNLKGGVDRRKAKPATNGKNSGPPKREKGTDQP